MYLILANQEGNAMISDKIFQPMAAGAARL
jgi:hypothetical protein